MDCEKNKKFVEWENAYLITSSEITSLINSFTEFNNITDAVSQDLIIKFATIHLCNFFVFTIRKALKDKAVDSNLVYGAFNNSSNIPSKSLMAKYLVSLGVEDIDYYSSSYKKVYEIRNKYAHGASGEIQIAITMDEYKELFEKLQKLTDNTILKPAKDQTNLQVKKIVKLHRIKRYTMNRKLCKRRRNCSARKIINWPLE
ncbi:hypothetical protein E4O03_13385 [Treponema sp. OMZ 792]|uniref:HEPN domain-containing protein n=1 Tax=unclassified Treponema TaxID=2638727 RepID=UPI0020A23932|nr:MULTISPECIES: HEPN domain-containing protein [unclassified Treponema]UTC75142.1 hypothetical protein E4O03_13385 [Treponema sp. OMZ 792]UTC81538.1 hypothetical protein E4O07_13300 [Treponema sp. OMZ 798]